jgi:hypothetical protein
MINLPLFYFSFILTKIATFVSADRILIKRKINVCLILRYKLTARNLLKQERSDTNPMKIG